MMEGYRIIIMLKLALGGAIQVEMKAKRISY
jgi:hypothetical protein